MIQIIKSPIEGTVFLSESPLEIEVRSNSGNDYYFKFIINVDGQLFDAQGWSKYTPTNCKIELQQMFTNVFTNEFKKIKETKLTRLDSLFKRVDIIVEEYNREDNTLKQKIEIPHFFVMYSQYNQHFNPNKSLQKLSQLPNPIRLTETSVFALPLWINSVNVLVRVLSGSRVLWEKSETNLEKGVYVFTCNLSEFAFQDRLRIEVSNENETFTQYIKIQGLYLYTVGKLYFKNIFGVFEYAEFFGSIKVTSSYKRKNYRLQDSTEFVANTEAKYLHKVNTGFLFPNETPMTDAVNLSEELYFYIEDVLYPVLVTSKKAKGIYTENYYDDDDILLQINGLPILDEEIIKYKKEDEILFEADYMVLTYNFIDGRDLDTRTRIVTPNIGQNIQTDYIGWGVKSKFPNENPVIIFGDDNTGVGKESVLINLKKIKELYPNEDKVIIDARAFWYGNIGVENVNLKVDLYRGGTMIKQGYSWNNPTAEGDFHFDTTGKKITLKAKEKTTQGERLSVATYDFNRNMVTFNNDDTITPEI